MGRGSKGKKEVVESESEEVEDIDVEDEDSNLNDPVLEDAHNHHEEILEDIKEQVGQTQHGEQLTWLALYGLKKQEIHLNSQMEDEIEAIRNKYELLKQPLYQQVSAAALGTKLDPQLYRHEELAVVPDLKAAPKQIPDFWGAVLSTEGLLSEEQDADVFKTLSAFNCEVLDQTANHIRVSMTFAGDNAYFSNKELSVEVKEEAESGAPIRILKNPIVYKKAVLENSLFTLLFDPKTEVQETSNIAHEIFQDYNNALYFYFREDDEEEDKQQGDQDEPIDIDEESEEEKPTKKKAKINPAVEKPECKNQ